MSLLRPRSWSFSLKFALTITAVVAGVAFTIGAVIVAQDWKRFRGGLEDKALTVARAVAVTAPEAIISSDYWSLFKNLTKLTTRASGGERDPRIVDGMILSADGTVLAHLNPAANPLGLPPALKKEEERRLLDAAMKARAPGILGGGKGEKGFIEGVVPVFSDEKLLASVRIRMSTAELYAQTRRAGFTILGLTLALVAAGSLLGAVISRRITSPLTALAKGMESVGRGDFSNISPVPIRDQDEIGDLAATFNRMAVELVEKKRLEEELAVNERMIALGRIAAGVAHEVNNPLAGMLNCLDNLKKHPDKPELFERYLPLIETGLNRIHAIVSGLLGELRVEGAQELAPPSCLDDLKELAIAEIGDRDIAIVWNNGLGDHLRINRVRLQQVVINLLKNALQAMPEGGKLDFRSFLNEDRMVLEVTDSGIGIPAEARGQLFDPFFTTRANGTGLGLWIVYGLVRSMDGEINFVSEPGRGSRFQVILPIVEEMIADIGSKEEIAV